MNKSADAQAGSASLLLEVQHVTEVTKKDKSLRRLKHR